MNHSDSNKVSSPGPVIQAEPRGVIYQLIYVSIAKHEFRQEELRSILETSRKHNLAHNITGLLLYSNQNIVQVLEGNQDEVRDLFERIRVDPRHHLVKMLSFEKVPKRDFSDWSMGFERGDEAAFSEAIPNFSDIVERKSVNLKILSGLSIKVGFVLNKFSVMNRLDSLKRAN